ncbi:hypothetical protein WJX82_011200 [Trebouxia sp. C0006]
MVYKVYIGGLPAGTTEADIERQFTKYGTLSSVWVARKPPGFAFVEYADSRDSEDAVRAMDGFNGWRVEHSRAGAPKPRQPSYGGSYSDRNAYSYSDRDRGRSGRDRSPPTRRRRSPSYDRSRRRSPSYDRSRRRSLSYDRRRRSPSPPPRRRRSPSPDRARGISDSPSRRKSVSPARSISPANGHV